MQSMEYRGLPCQGQGAEGLGDDEKGQAQGGDAGVALGVGQHVGGGAKEPEQLPQKQLDQHGVGNAQHGGKGDGVPGDAGGFFLLPPAQVEGEAGGAAGGDEQPDGQGNGGEGVRHIGGGVAKVPHPPADEHLVHDVVKGTDQHGDDAGDGEAGEELWYLLPAQGVLLGGGLVHGGHLLSVSVKAAPFAIVWR